MTRRQWLLSAAACLMIAPRRTLAQEHEPHTPFTDWVRRFYVAQIAARARRDGWATSETEAGADAGLEFPFPEYLTAEMQALYTRASAKPVASSDAPDGPILDEIFGWGAFPNRPIKVIAVEPASWWNGLGWQGLGGGDIALLTIEIDGNERDLTIKGHYDAPTFNWEIADIDYGEGSDETLLERLERLAE